jgi:hypothetical protein
MFRLPLLPLALAACTSHPPDWSPHAAIVQDPELTALPDHRVPPPAPLRQPGDRPQATVYGYWPYWGDPLDTLQWDQLTHVALFSVGMTTAGALTDTYKWTNNAATAMSLAAPWGVRVHLTLTSFYDNETNAVLSSPALRTTVINNLVNLVNQYGAHGVNVDIEGLDGAQRANFVAFIAELNTRVPDVFLATPAIDWNNAFDYAQLAANSDGMFIMGYGYHWSGGSPGPGAPLYSQAPWGTFSLDWSVQDYRSSGAPDDKIILGLPLYGIDWPTASNAIPGVATGSGVSSVYTSAIRQANITGRQWDAASSTAYTFPSSTHQLWYDDASSVEMKAQYAVDEGLQGFGFWALTYDDADPTLWGAIDAITHGITPPPPPNTLAVEAPIPARAGRSNLLQATGAQPNARLRFAMGLSSGTSTLRGCPGLTVDAARVDVTSVATANSYGNTAMSTWVPANAAGRTIKLWVYDVDRCVISPVRLVSL